MASTQAPAVAGTATPSLADLGIRMGFIPWRRYFARTIDLGITGIAIYGLIYLWMSLLVGASAYETVAEVLRFMLDVFLLLLALSFLIGIAFNAVWLRFTGTTPGKFIFGIRVHERDGNKLSLGRALARELRVWVQGLFFGIPLLSQLAQLAAYGYLEENGDTLWDRRMGLSVRYRTATTLQRVVWTVAIVFILFGGSLIGKVMGN